MKILLVGEFSGVHNNLKKGLTELGHNVKLAADGDGFKNFGSDFKVAPYQGIFVGKIKNLLYILRSIRKFVGYDIVQFINPFSLPYYYSFFLITYIIFKFNKKSVYYACGTDPAFLASKDKFDYFPFDDPMDKEYPKYNYLSLLHYRLFIKFVDAIVPSMYTYAVGYSNNKKLTPPIPLPGSVFISSPSRPVSNSIKILFGITRSHFKGVKIILTAIAKLKEELENDNRNNVQIVIVERLPFIKFVEYLKECDILIDQCKSYDYGMSALLGLENGLVVLSGSEPAGTEFLKIEQNAVINIKPNAELIYCELKKLTLLSVNELFAIRERGFIQARTYHYYKNVSNCFIKEYVSILSYS